MENQKAPPPALPEREKAPRLTRRESLLALAALPPAVALSGCAGGKEAPSLPIGGSTLRQPAKVGIGVWEAEAGSALAWTETMGFGWYYNWRPDPLRDGVARRTVPFVPMIWGRRDVDRTPAPNAPALLGFNEPDGQGPIHQSNLSVDEAITLWPKLMAHGLRLGSPATTMGGTLGTARWLPRFMAECERRGYRIDFMAVHYYSRSGSVERFESWLRDVHEAYGRPVWVTEWCHVDWGDRQAISAGRNAAFARAALPMLDALPFVERHAWFAANPYRKFDAPTHLFDDRLRLTVVGEVFRAALADAASAAGA